MKRSPDKASVLNNLGYAYMLAGRGDDAKVAFKASLQGDPNYYKARNNLQRLAQDEDRINVR